MNEQGPATVAKEWPRSAATTSIVVALVFAGITVLAHSHMAKLEAQGASRALSADARNLGERLAANIALRVPTIRRHALVWGSRPVPSRRRSSCRRGRPPSSR